MVSKAEIQKECDSLRERRDGLRLLNEEHGNKDGFYDMREELALLADTVLEFNARVFHTTK